MPGVIETVNLSRNFGKTRAVDDISITVEKGEIYGFLGLNGAGKTTTIRMLLGMIRPSAGEVLLYGEQVNGGKPDLWKRVGSLVEIPYSYPDLTVDENLEIIRKLRYIADRKYVNEVIDLLSLNAYRKIIAKHLSLGNAQRLGLAKALLHKPDILILDEPANGLDPAGIVEIRELLLDLAENKGVTIFISSHILGEISKFASRIGIIHEGRLLVETDIDDLEKLRKRTLQIGVENIENAKHFLENSNYHPVIDDAGTILLSDTEAIVNPGKINAHLAKDGNPPFLVKVEEEDLESFFLRVIHLKGGEL
jgi:ABC-2 type transport system ATP-binding protein